MTQRADTKSTVRRRALSWVLLDAIFTTRPVVLVPVWVFAVLGVSRARVVFGRGLLVWGDDQLALLCRIVVFSLSVAAVYVVNQLADREVDRLNGGFPLFARGGIPASTGLAVIVVCLAASLGGGYALERDGRLLIPSLGAFGLGIVYSCRPTFFSGRPILDFLANAVGFGVIAFGAGWHLAGPEPGSVGQFAASCVPYVLLMCAGSISSTIPDLDGDRAGGKMTTAVLLGTRRAHLLAATFIGATLVVSGLQRDFVALACAAAAAPLYVMHFVRHSRGTMEATYKAGGTAVSIIAATIFPLLLPVAGGVFGATWLYFRFRHHVSYPSLVPATHAK